MNKEETWKFRSFTKRADDGISSGGTWFFLYYFWVAVQPDDMTRECLEKRENGILYVFYVFQCRWIRRQKKTSYNIHTYRYVHKKREENDSWDEGIQKMKLIGMRNAFSFTQVIFFLSFFPSSRKKLYRAEKKKNKRGKKKIERKKSRFGK